MKVLIFLMGNVDSFEMTRSLLRSLRGAGVEVTLAHYSSEELVPVDDLIATGARYLPLSDGGFGTIPRLAHRQYQALCGDDLDFLGCQYHNLARLGFPATRDYLFRDSMFHQWFHGFAYRAEVLLRECRPDAVIVNHGSEPLSKILYAKSQRLGIPTLLLESAFVPGKVLLDPVGMHFFPGQHRIERDWPNVRETELSTDQQERLDRYLASWHERGASKYSQAESNREVEGLTEFAADGRRLLFVVDQIPYDANIINGFRAFASFAEMVNLAREGLPEGWSAVYKLHPRNPDSAGVPLGREGDRFFVVRDVSIHRLFKISEAVLTYSSNVGLEALATDKAVIVGGLPHYAGRGLTLDLTHVDEFARLLDESTSFRPDRVLRDRFLQHILFDYLIDANDSEAILRRIEEANGPVPHEPARCPFSNHYAPRFAAFRTLADSYNRLAVENLAHEEIMSRLSISEVDQSSEGWSRLESGERQVAVDESGIAPNHLIRYQLAGEFLAPGMDVLDLSCGIGYGTFLLGHGTGAHRVVGVDCSAEAIAFAREFWSDEAIEYVCASAGSYPLGESAFDLIVSYETVEHLANDRAFVAALWRALRPGGVLLLSAPHQLGYPMTQHAFHIQHYTEDGLLDLLHDQPDLEAAQVLGQVADTRLEGRAGGKHLIAVARRSGRDGASEALSSQIARLMPFERTGPPCPPRPLLQFAPHRFLGEGIERQEGRLVATAESANRHIVFGPYIRLAVGTYAAGFRLGLDGTARTRVGARVVLDVATGNGRQLAKVALEDHHLRDLAGHRRLVALPFRHDSGDDVLQFRIYLEGESFEGRLEFFGLELRGLTMHGDEAAVGIPATPEQAFQVMDLVTLERERAEAALQELQRIKDEFAKARESFAEADAFYQRARDDWEDRFRNYERRLLQLEKERDEFGRRCLEQSQRCDQLAREVERAAGSLMAEREESARQLAAMQTQLRPYRIIDRMGMVSKSYGLARRIKRRLVS